MEERRLELIADSSKAFDNCGTFPGLSTELEEGVAGNIIFRKAMLLKCDSSSDGQLSLRKLVIHVAGSIVGSD